MNYHESIQSKIVQPHISSIGTKILSVGTYLPSEVWTSDSIMSEINSEQNYDIPVNWMSEEMGILERRVSPFDAKPSELAIPAAQKAIDNLGINPDLIDMVLFCGIERDLPEPATAHIIQDKLGLNAMHAFDLSNACFGFMQAIETASHYLRSGAVRYALVCTGEIPSKIMRAAIDYLKTGIDKDEVQGLLGALTVGDAGGAIVLGQSEYDENVGFKLFHTKTDSSYVEKCFYGVNTDGTYCGQMLMGKIVGASIWMHRKLIDDTLEMLGWDTFDWLLAHQTGRRPFEKFQALSTVDADCVTKTYDTLANITSATFPVNYEKMLGSGKVGAGSRIGGIHSGSGLVVGEFGYQM